MSTFPLLRTKSEGNKMASLFEIAVALSKPAFSPLPIKIIIHKRAESVASEPLLHVLTSTEIHLTPVSQTVGLNLRVLGTLTRDVNNFVPTLRQPLIGTSRRKQISPPLLLPLSATNQTQQEERHGRGRRGPRTANDPINGQGNYKGLSTRISPETFQCSASASGPLHSLHSIPIFFSHSH